MPNDLSNEFHQIEKDAKAFFLKELAKLEHEAAVILDDIKQVLVTTADQAGPVLRAAAVAGATAALTGATGGLSGIATAAEGAAVAVLSSQGLQLADKAFQQLKVLVLANVLKASSGPYTASAPVTLPTPPAPTP